MDIFGSLIGGLVGGIGGLAKDIGTAVGNGRRPAGSPPPVARRVAPPAPRRAPMHSSGHCDCSAPFMNTSFNARPPAFSFGSNSGWVRPSNNPWGI